MTEPQQPQEQQFQYVALPDGSYGKFAANADDATIRSAIEKDFPDAFKQPDERNGLQKAFDAATTAEPYSADAGIVGNAGRAFRNLGGGFLSLATPLVHPEQTVEGVANLAGNLMNPQTSGTAAVSLLKPAMKQEGETKGQYAGRLGGEATQAVGGIVGGEGLTEALPAAAGIGGELVKKLPIPTRAKAGELFESVAKDAANQPVSLTRSEPILQKMLQLGREGGGTVPAPVRQLAGRINAAPARSVPLLRQMQNDLSGATAEAAQPNPLLYPSARNFQSGLASLSREDAGAMGGPMKGQLKQLNKALFDDTKDATSRVGRADDYVKAMRMNRNAARIGELVDNLKKVAIPAAATAAGSAGLYKLYKAFQ